MRLTQDQASAIHQAATEAFGSGAEVWLFGSRADDSRRGGDIDLLIRPDASATDQPVRRKLRMLGRLERTLGECKVDVVIERDNDSRPIVRVAHETGVRL